MIANSSTDFRHYDNKYHSTVMEYHRGDIVGVDFGDTVGFFKQKTAYAMPK